MNRLQWILLGGGLLVLGALGLHVWMTPGAGIPLLASTSPGSSREYGAALLGLLLIGFFAMGFDWQDWL